MDLSKRVRARRRALELSQESLARRADVSMSLVNQIERGLVTDPHYSTLVSLAGALGLSVAELVDGPKSYGGTRFEQYLLEAREKSRDELRRRLEELEDRLEELSQDPAGLPRKLGGQSSPSHLRKLTEAAAEARAILRVRDEMVSKLESKALA